MSSSSLYPNEWGPLIILAYTALHIYCAYWAYGWALGAFQQAFKGVACICFRRDHIMAMLLASGGPIGLLFGLIAASDLGRVHNVTIAPQWSYIEWFPRKEKISPLQQALMVADGW